MTQKSEQHAIACPHCKASLRVCEDLLRSKLQCRFCGAIFLGQSEPRQDAALPMNRASSTASVEATRQESKRKSATETAPPQPTRIAARAAGSVTEDDIPAEWAQADIAPHNEAPDDSETHIQAPASDARASDKATLCPQEDRPLEDERKIEEPTISPVQTEEPQYAAAENSSPPIAPAPESRPAAQRRTGPARSNRRIMWLVLAAILLIAMGGVLVLLLRPWENPGNQTPIPEGGFAPPQSQIVQPAAAHSRPTCSTVV